MPALKNYTVGFRDYQGTLLLQEGIHSHNCAFAIEGFWKHLQKARKDFRKCEVAFVMNDKGVVEYPKGHTFRDGKLFLPNGEEYWPEKN
jgi:hypothetical protein